MKETKDNILSIIDDIQYDFDRICGYYEKGLIPKCEEPFYSEKLKLYNLAMLNLLKAVLYLDESEEYQK